MSELKKLIVSAPFGNYLQWPNVTPTMGTFTREYRGGKLKRLWRVMRTVWYYPGICAWKNKLGLPNPGIQSLVDGEYAGVDLSDKIVSISARQTTDWLVLFDTLLRRKPLLIEMNVSCPNCPNEKDETDYDRVLSSSLVSPQRVIVKLPPVNYEHYVRKAMAYGVNRFHCCNTLPTPGGGMSGKPLMLLSLRAIAEVYKIGQQMGVEPATVIGGGGITSFADAERYQEAGATNVAVASVLFFPWAWSTVREIADKLAAEG
jgi:dihydroorotate dehydrogenase